MPTDRAADLFRRHHLRVYRFLRRLTGDDVLAEDLTQDVFVRALRGLDRYEERERELAWLLRIAVNLDRDERRRRRRRPRAVELEEAEVIGRAAGQEQSSVLADALARLAEADRAAFLLREVGGLGYEEIAAATALTTDAVRSRIFRARRTLRELLAGTGLQRRVGK